MTLRATGRDLVGRIAPIRRLREQRGRLAGEVTSLEEQLRHAEAASAPRHADTPVDGERVATSAVREAFPPGHFYSPIPDLDAVRVREDRIFSIERSLPGIDLGTSRQLGRLEHFAALYSDLPYPDTGPSRGLRYQFDNPFFAHGDGIAYYAMLRSIRPRRIIEIGSGWSSALALDVNDVFLEGSADLTFVEPYPDRLDALLRPHDRDHVRVLAEPLHHVDASMFDALERGDVLFIDSTHVSKVGSDVNQLFLEVLPTLTPGVHVHVHDIFYPFEYPKEWVYDGRAWNENYLLRALLTDNDHLRINWFNSYLALFHGREVTAAMPLWARNPGGSIWLERA